MKPKSKGASGLFAVRLGQEVDYVVEKDALHTQTALSIQLPAVGEVFPIQALAYSISADSEAVYLGQVPSRSAARCPRILGDSVIALQMSPA